LSDFSAEDILARIEYALTDPGRRRELHYELLLVDEGGVTEKIQRIVEKNFNVHSKN